MEPIIYMGLGAAGVVCLIIMKISAAHGWAAVQAWLKQRASAAEAKLHAEADKLDARIKDVVHSELAKVESDIATLKTKVGL